MLGKSSSMWVVLTATVLVACALGLVAQEPSGARASDGKTAPRKILVRVQKLPGMTVMTRSVVGSYAQHPALIQELLGRARSLGVREAPQGNLIGIYPMDPDAMDRQEDLKWFLAVQAPAGTVKAKMAVSPGLLPSGVRADFGALEARFATMADTSGESLTMAPLNPTLALTAQGSYEAVPVVGLAMKEAMYTNGYVQTAPTRTVLLAGDPSTPVDDQIQIIFPVAERPGGLGAEISKLVVQQQGVQGGRAMAPTGGQMIEVQVQQVPQLSVVVRDLKGAVALAKSGDACSEALSAAAVPSAVRSQATCTRIDIVDPDAAVGSPEKVEWRLAVSASEKQRLRAGPSLRASRLPSTLAVTRETTADRANVERQAINAWIVRSGYVHSEPTRTEFQPGNSKVRLVIPVKSRLRQIPIEFAEAELVRD